VSSMSVICIGGLVVDVDGWVCEGSGVVFWASLVKEGG
jgi:hypothetical protein